MTTPSTCTCAACGLVLPIAEFSRYYTLTEAVRRGYGKPFDDRHAYIAADNRTVYSRIPQRVQYYGKYCRSCKPQKPFIDMRTEANIYLAASLGWFKQITGSYQMGVLIFAGLAVLAIIGLASVKTRWRTTWGSASATSAKV